MPRARIEIASVVGSNPPNGTALVIDTAVQLSNDGNGGELTYLWEFLDRPEGSAAAFTNPAIENPLFTPDVEGTYLLRLRVNAALATESTDIAIAGISQIKTYSRIPAAGEALQSSTSRGWALAVNHMLVSLDNSRVRGPEHAGFASATSTVGQVFRIGDADTLMPGLPREELLPVFTRALATDALDAASVLGVMAGSPTGATTVASGEIMAVRYQGLFGPCTLGGVSVGDPVYLSNTGTISATPGTLVRRLGSVVYIDGADAYIGFEGAASGGTTGANEPYLFAAAPIGVYSAARNLQALTSDLEFRSTADSVAARLIRFSSTQTDPVLALFEQTNTNPVFYVDGHGDVYMFDPDGDGVRSIISNVAMDFTAAGGTLSLGGTQVLLQIGGTTQWAVSPSGHLEAIAGARQVKNLAAPTAAGDAVGRDWFLARSFTTLSWGNQSVAVSAASASLDPGFCDRAATLVATGTYAKRRATRAGVLRNLYARIRTGPTGFAVDLTVYVNGSASSITVTATDGSADLSVADTTNTQAVAAGDLIEIRTVPAGLILTPMADIQCELELCLA